MTKQQCATETRYRKPKPTSNFSIGTETFLPIFFSKIIHFYFHDFLIIIFFLHLQTPYYQTENEKKQKKRIAPSVLTDEQKQLVADEMSDANLGLLCNVCGKIFKSRDALDFHIMYTKLPGHDVLQQVIYSVRPVQC